MGLFDKKEVQPTEEDLAKVRIKVLGAYALAEVFDAEVLKEEGKLRKMIEHDLARFTMFVADADENIQVKELESINMLLGTSLVPADCIALLEGKDDNRYMREMPETFVILRDNMDTGIDELLANYLIEVYSVLGQTLAGVDGKVARDEKFEINGFIALLRRYAVRD